MTSHILECELLIKFSDFVHLFPQKNGVWNCGFTHLNNKFYFLCRNEVSKYNEAYFGRKLETWHPRVAPVLATFHNDFTLEKVTELQKSENLTLSDVRAFSYKGNLFSTGTVRSHKPQKDGKRRVDQFLARVIEDKFIFLPFEHSFELPQKNWSPITQDGLFFENWEQKGARRRNILAYSNGKLNLVKSTLTKKFLRGNSQIVDVGDWLLAAYHYHSSRYYYHYFALLEKTFPFDLVKISEPFRFSLGNDKREHIQFLTGMEKIGDNLLVSYGVQDSDNFLCAIKLKTILESCSIHKD